MAVLGDHSQCWQYVGCRIKRRFIGVGIEAIMCNKIWHLSLNVRRSQSSLKQHDEFNRERNAAH